MISGLAVPYGVVARQGGRSYCHLRGSLTWTDPSRVKLLIQHDSSQIVGRAVDLTEVDEGLHVRLRTANTPAGRRALALVEDGVYTGLSIGLGDGAQFDLRGDIYYASGPLVEISLTPTPAYDTARIGAQ